MKRFVTTMFILITGLFSAGKLYSQTYLNILYTDASEKYLAIASVQKITFDEIAGKVNFILTDASTQAVTFSTLQRLTSTDIPTGSSLPVELISFNGTVNHATVSLYWKTATEVNNYGFDIERSTPGSEWKKITFIKGHGTSDNPNEYAFTDTHLNGTTFHYRLKQIDINGTYTYSAVVNIQIGTPTTYELKQNYPNPFNPNTTIGYQLPVDGFVTLKVYDVLGREVATLVNENKKAGIFYATFDGSRFSSGMYICRMSTAAYCSTTKMQLTK